MVSSQAAVGHGVAVKKSNLVCTELCLCDAHRDHCDNTEPPMIFDDVDVTYTD